MPTASAVLDPFIKAMNSIPRVILAPIFTLWFGLGMASKVALGVTLVFFVAFFNTYQGIKEVDPVVLANARMLGASGSQLLRHVYLPSAASWIFSSLRTSIGFAVIGAVVGEYMGAAKGLGYLISQPSNKKSKSPACQIRTLARMGPHHLLAKERPDLPVDL